MSNHEFFEFCQRNRDWHIERTSHGEWIIMPPTGGKTGQFNFDLNVAFGSWVKANGTGVGFDSSTGFTLPNGAELRISVSLMLIADWPNLLRALHPA